MYLENEDFLRHEKDVNDIFDIFGYSGIELDESMLLLDVGAGQGMHAGFLAKRFKKIYCIDLIPYNSIYDKSFHKLLAEKYQRNQIHVSMDRLCFIENSATDLIFKDDFFDLTVSINSLEHIHDPQKAIEEMVRVTKPGGYLYITFDPLWTADTGSHFSHRVQEPWAQLILNEQEFIEKMRHNGAGSQEIHDFRHGLNRLPPSYYRTVFGKLTDSHQLEVIDHAAWPGVVKECHTQHPNLAILAARGYSAEALMLRGMRYVLHKPDRATAGTRQELNSK